MIFLARLVSLIACVVVMSAAELPPQLLKEVPKELPKVMVPRAATAPLMQAAVPMEKIWESAVLIPSLNLKTASAVHLRRCTKLEMA